ncbi:MAG: polyprenyl synthetase family protein [Methylophilaceae bacterium]
MKIIISSHFDEFFMPPEATADLHLVKKEIQKALQDKKTILNEWLKFQNRSKGKFIRAQLALASGELLNLPKNTVIKWSAACELIHTASLIHDDICDQDVKRRGVTTIWKKYGVPAAICLGDFIIAQAFQKLSEIETGWHQTILLNSLSLSMKKIIVGQVSDVGVDIKKISMKDYEQIAYEKTGPLLMTPLDGMFRCKELPESELNGLNKLMNSIGLAYQMINDYKNIKSKKTDISLNHLNFISILMKENNIKNNDKQSIKLSLTDAHDRIIKKLNEIDKYIHQVPIILQPIFISIVNQLKETL